MNSEAYLVLKIISGVFSGLFTLLAACFAFIARLQDGKHQKTADWFQNRWRTIRDSKWFNLLEIVIEWLLSARNELFAKFISILDSQSQRARVLNIVLNILFITFPWPLLYCLLYGDKNAKLACSVSLTIAPLIVVFLSRILHKKQIISFEVKLLGFFILVTPIFWTTALLNAEILISMVAALILIPVYWICGVGVLMFFSGSLRLRAARFSLFGGLTIALSFVLTFSAFFIGHKALPNAWIPQTLQMLISNVIFDGLTILTTFWLMSQGFIALQHDKAAERIQKKGTTNA